MNSSRPGARTLRTLRAHTPHTVRPEMQHGHSCDPISTYATDSCGTALVIVILE